MKKKTLSQPALIEPPKEPVPGEPARLTYTLHEAAALLGISYLSVYRLVKRKKIGHVKLLRHLLITHEEIQRVLKVHFQKAA